MVVQQVFLISDDRTCTGVPVTTITALARGPLFDCGLGAAMVTCEL